MKSPWILYYINKNCVWLTNIWFENRWSRCKRVLFIHVGSLCYTYTTKFIIFYRLVILRNVLFVCILLFINSRRGRLFFILTKHETEFDGLIFVELNSAIFFIFFVYFPITFRIAVLYPIWTWLNFVSWYGVTWVSQQQFDAIAMSTG